VIKLLVKMLPIGRRMQAMKLAHETYGAHMAAKSTCKRLSYSFWWPTITRDVKNYVATCDRCVRRSRITVYDRTRIRSIERSSRAFLHWWCDIAGLLFPNQKVDYNYCFVACDNNTHWPVAFALRSVTAKNICDCLMKLWMTFGVSQFVSLENAAYNTSKLTKIFMKIWPARLFSLRPGTVTAIL